VRARLGEGRIHTGHRLGAFEQDEAASPPISSAATDRTATARGDVLIGADGIHSYVRETLYPNEGPARWNGIMLWRGALPTGRVPDRPLDGDRGRHAAKLVVYPIAEGSRETAAS
jgi:5-methylphenazine-1-carboxylate 1-monooxygenase